MLTSVERVEIEQIGYSEGLRGFGQEVCPFRSVAGPSPAARRERLSRRLWLRGWHAGYDEYISACLSLGMTPGVELEE